MGVKENLIELLTTVIFVRDGVDPAEAIADFLIDNGVTIQKWIPVAERMPEKEGSYLIWTTIYFTPDHVDECNHYDGMVIADFHPEFGFMGRAGVNAKAWMPLPEPPKEDVKFYE